MKIKGAFWRENPNPDFRIKKRILRVFLGKFKNGSWIHKIHTQGGFFGSNPNPDFFKIHNLSVFLGKDLKKVFLISGFPNENGTQQMPYMYDILTKPMLVGP